jgi:aspartate carbamoyltransferase regulatory subunit
MRSPRRFARDDNAIFTREREVGMIQNWASYSMVNYILLYKIRKKIKKILKDKIADDELATTERSCIGCVADEISWEIYYIMKEKDKSEQ